MFGMRQKKLPLSDFYLSFSKVLYSVGAIFVAFALLLSTGILSVRASSSPAPSQQERLFCDFGSNEGSVVKVEDQESPWTFTVSGNGYISVVGIKAATECAILFTSDGTSTCYEVTGIGTQTVTVWDREDAPPSCREISHLEILVVDPTPSPTAQENTPTPTDDPGTETPVPTATFTDIPPTDTPEFTPTATFTDIPPTDTPEFTPTATFTDVPPTDTPEFTPTATFTDVPPTDTPEFTPTPTDTDVRPTDQPEFTPTPTDTDVRPTDQPESTATDTGDPATETPVPTVPPPSSDSESLLIPVTGAESPLSAADIFSNQAFLIRISSYVGMLFFGLGLVTHGASIWHRRKED